MICKLVIGMLLQSQTVRTKLINFLSEKNMDIILLGVTWLKNGIKLFQIMQHIEQIALNPYSQSVSPKTAFFSYKQQNSSHGRP